LGEACLRPEEVGVLSKIRSGLNYANVVATLALFLALGGGAYAAINLPKDSVGARQIKKDAVRAAEVKKAAVGSSEVKDRSLRSDDFGDGELPVGARGPRGFRGPPGTAGSARAYGAVAENGTITHAKGVSGDATRPDGTDGIYCVPLASSIDRDDIVVITGERHAASATDVTLNNKVLVEWLGPGGTFCPGNSEQILTFVAKPDGDLILDDEPFVFMVP